MRSDVKMWLRGFASGAVAVTLIVGLETVTHYGSASMFAIVGQIGANYRALGDSNAWAEKAQAAEDNAQKAKSKG